ncbi:hypothetical protein AKI39_03395 [Bordetella sp. H567]|uniref:TMEM175 family protein n=1 Tax=Bordetella sp. H567 TaxID=1697043 RepID=UPI00081C8189|nr:TMEM175 family protein [Bordetella sp. H567]AOB29939.1 hypothetical protein AKI39_03395 [Bordetella sp. H567]
MTIKPASAERLNAFSDGVFAVIITVLVLDLRAPTDGHWSALFELWPVAISYAASYLFVAIVWINHHHLMRFADLATPRLIWCNFGHLFTVSLLPFTTSWMAETSLSSVPVFAYAGAFALVNLSYIALMRETMDRTAHPDVSATSRTAMHRRSSLTLAIFTLSGILALWHPYLGFGLVVCCLLTYLRPDTRL